MIFVADTELPAAIPEDAADLPPGSAALQPGRWRAPAAPSFGLECWSHRKQLMNYARRLTRNTTTAEDLVQEVYLRALRYPDHFEPGTNLQAWLMKLLHNLYADFVRREIRRSAFAPTAHDTVTTTEASQVERVELAELIAKLPEHWGEVAALAAGGAEYETIASDLGLPLGTVRSRLHHARDFMRKLLTDNGASVRYRHGRRRPIPFHSKGGST